MRGCGETVSPKRKIARSKATCFRLDHQGTFDGRSPSLPEKSSTGSFECHHYASGGFHLEAQERRF